uniref:RING-type E3 ubiquitin transferase n=1 Tax=Castor canadensis TaxID=51338 RepID=A0A8B7TVK5_CASCN|nr:E3 ubiquitin-protein ligase Topors-like [Castor canadensis]
MAVDLSSDCECPNCLEGVHSDTDWNLDSSNRSNGSLHSRSRKKSMPSPSTEQFLSQCYSPRLENNHKEDLVFVPSEEESYVGFSQKSFHSLSPDDIKKKIRPLGELTIQDLLREFGVTGKFRPNSMSLGHFRDQVVMKFRRALYYSGIWVKYVRGYRLEKHFSANYFKKNPGSLHRLVPWLKRELTAVYGDYGYTVKNILDAILHLMKEYDLDSESFIHLLEPYLLQHTHHFLHEFISFVHSPYNMETYDRRAIYQCPSASTWVRNKSIVSAPVLLKNYAAATSQHDTEHSNDTQVQWDNEERPQSDLKQFSNSNSALKKSKIPLAHHKTASKIHVSTKDKPESDDHKSTVSSNNILLNRSPPKERGPGVLNCKKYAQEEKTEEIKLLPGYVQDLQMSETTVCTFRNPAISNQVQPQKYDLREERPLNSGKKIHFQAKEAEKNKHSESPNFFQRLPRGRSLVSCKSRERDPSWSCISENALSPKKDGRKLSSYRKKRTKSRESLQFVEIGSQSSGRTRRRSRSTSYRSKSWCVGPRKRSVSRDLSNLNLSGSHRRERLTQLCCEPSKENVYGQGSNYERASLSPLQFVKLPSTTRKRPNWHSKDEGASQTRSHCGSLTGLQTEKHRNPSKQEMKQKNMFPRVRRTRAVRQKKTKCQFTDMQTKEKFSDELWDLDDIRQMRSLSECAPACRRQTEREQNSSLQKHHRAKNECRRDIVSGT